MLIKAVKSSSKRRRVLGAAGAGALLVLAGQSPGHAVVAPILPDQQLGSASGDVAGSGIVPGQAIPDQEIPEPASPGQASVAPGEGGLSTSDASGGTPDPSAVRTPETANPAGVEVWTTLRATAQDALNAHTSDLSDPQLLAALGTPGTLTFNLRVDPALAMPKTSVLDSAWVSCSRKTWCGTGQVVTIAGLAGTQQPLQWSDYTGSVWDRMALTSPGRTPLTETPGNSLHVIKNPAVASDAAGATTWVGQLWPTISDPELLPRPGQVLTVKARSTTQDHDATLAVTTPEFPISVPVVNATTIGTISADTLTTDSAGRLALSLWRPQSLGATAEDPVTDMAGLNYGLSISDGTTSVSCSPQRFSEGVGVAVTPDLAADTADAGTLPLRDSAPVDLPITQASSIGFTVDVAGCLADASARGQELGAALQVTILAGSSPTGTSTDVINGANSSSAGVTYRLVILGR